MKTPAQDIILAPVITEASMAGIALKKYTSRLPPTPPRWTSPARLKSCSA